MSVVGRGLGGRRPAHDPRGLFVGKDVPHAVGREHERHIVRSDRVAADLRLGDHAHRLEPAVAEASGHHEPTVAPHDVGRVDLGPHLENARPFVVGASIR